MCASETSSCRLLLRGGSAAAAAAAAVVVVAEVGKKKERRRKMRVTELNIVRKKFAISVVGFRLVGWLVGW